MSVTAFSIRDSRPKEVKTVVQLWRQADTTPSATGTVGDLSEPLPREDQCER